MLDCFVLYFTESAQKLQEVQCEVTTETSQPGVSVQEKQIGGHEKTLKVGGHAF